MRQPTPMRFVAVAAALMFLGVEAAWAADPPRNAPAVRLPDGVKVERDIEYAKVGDLSLRLDIYSPDKVAAGPLPLVVWIYGGAWMGGDKTRFPLAALATQGYVVASIEYRHSQVAIFPAQIEDAKAAIRFLRANARKYAIEPDHIGVWGESSGGHLAALLGVGGDARELEGKEGQYLAASSRVQAVVDCCGPADFPLFLQTLTPGATRPVEGLLGGVGDKVKDLAVKASPVHYASKDAAAFLIFHGDKDNTVPIGQSRSLHEALKAAGADVTFEVLKGVGHQTMSPTTIAAGTAFLDKHLKQGRANHD